MTEKWVKIHDFDYEISNYGNVKSGTLILKPQPNSKGYLRVNLHKNGVITRKFVHRLVAQHFIPNPALKPQVNHKDGNKKNNHFSNLEWMTNSENQLHGRKMGLIADLKGEEVPSAKLTEENVRWIKTNCGKGRGYGYKALAKKFGVSHTTIRNIMIGKKWSHVETCND